MEGTLSSQLPEFIGKTVTIKGWVHNIRVMGNLGFVTVRDRGGVSQVVIDDKKLIDEFKPLQPGTIVYVEGKVNKTDKTDLGVEIIEPKVEFKNKVTEAWPIEINKPELNASLDTILANRALTLRHEKLQAVFKIQGVMAQAYREYMIEHGFTEFFGPSMIASSSEGGAEVFKLNYFGKEATLAQSNQLYKQMMVGVYGGVFGMAKWFRAENSNTRRHLTEGMQYEFEMGFIEDFREVMLQAEGVIRHMLKRAEEKCQRELKLAGIKLVVPPKSDVEFPKYKFSEAVKVVSQRTGEDTSDWKDLTPEAERELCDYAREKYGTDFIWVTNYPKGVFYAYRDENGTYYNYDLLCREAEVISGGRRIDNHDKLVESIKAAGMNPADFKEYLSIFKYGMPPHGGFGLGFERFTMMALGLENIREATLFPSDTKRVASQSLPEKKTFGAEVIKKAIKQLFVDNDLEFQVLKHEPTPTSEDSAKVRELGLETGVKALILKDKKTGENVLVAVPAHKKLDLKKIPDRKFEFEKPEVIKEKYGLEVGGVPPLGQIFGIETYIDQSIFDQEISAFNNCDQRESLICKSADLKKVMEGKSGDYIA